MVEKSFEVSSKGCLRSSRRIVEAVDLEALLSWITPERILSLPNQIKDRIRAHILLAIRRRGSLLEKSEKSKLSEMPIFKELIATETPCGDVFRLFPLKVD